MCTTQPELINRDLLAFISGESIAASTQHQVETA
jgi:hypothetical protein